MNNKNFLFYLFKTLTKSGTDTDNALLNAVEG